MTEKKETMVDYEKFKVPIEKLARVIDPEKLAKADSRKVKKMNIGIIGQKRALEALKVGAEIESPHHHIYVAGPKGIGKTSFVKSCLEEIIRGKKPPLDWLYVGNSEEPDKLKAISLPAGLGKQFKNDIEEVPSYLFKKIHELIGGSDNFDEKIGNQDIQSVRKKHSDFREPLSAAMNKIIAEAGFSVRFDSLIGKFIFTSLGSADGNQLKPEDGEKNKQKFQERIQKQEFIDLVNQFFQDLAQEKIEINQIFSSCIMNSIRLKMRAMFKKYKIYPQIHPYIKDFFSATISYFGTLMNEKSDGNLHNNIPQPPFVGPGIKLFVDNSENKLSPIVIEYNTSLSNLFGAIENAGLSLPLPGMPVDETPDIERINPGAFHKANGGFLVLRMADILWSPRFPLLWKLIKEALKTRKLRIKDYNSRSIMHPISAEIEPIPLDLKVILIGSYGLYLALKDFDEDFDRLFGILAKFDAKVDLNDETLKEYAEAIEIICRRNHTRIDKDGKAKLIEYALRLAEDQKEFSVKLVAIRNIIIEAKFWSQKAGRNNILAEDIKTAIRKQEERMGLEAYQKRFKRRISLVETSGHKTGQLNGLVVYEIGDYYLGEPVKITAVVSAGSGNVISIDRDVKLSGRISNKAAMILSSYFRSCYGQKSKLEFFASICFEQIYEIIDGDSATLGETAALISELAGVPIRQELAITGSMNQKGEAQAIGGVNAKIEGFLNVCKIQGLTKNQGVIIPRSNVQYLMLKDEVIQAVRDGEFAIYAIETIDEAIELLTGISAEVVRQKVGERLDKFARQLLSSRKKEWSWPVRRL